MSGVPYPKLDNSPLVMVLAQVRFPAFLKMADRIPDIQEALRAQEFSRYTDEQIKQIHFGPETKISEEHRWVFASRDRREAVLLTQSFVTYETNNYDVFETMLSRFSDVLTVIERFGELEFTEQVGLRYVNLIRSLQDMNVRTGLHESVQGLTAEALSVDQVQQRMVMQADTDYGKLYIRLTEVFGDDFLPSDLASTPDHLDFEVDSLGEEVGRILDIDHFYHGQGDFVIDELKGLFLNLHEHTSKAFHAAVTATAMEAWKGGDGK